MGRLKKRNKTISTSGRLSACAGLLLAVFWGCRPEPTQPPTPAQPPRAERAAAVVDKTDVKKDNLYGLPIVISFPDIPQVPEKIKAPEPTSGGLQKALKSGL